MGISICRNQSFHRGTAENSTDTCGSLRSDCEPRTLRPALGMHVSHTLMLSPEDKLDALQFLDEFRFWRSLDDERRCTRCHETITGRRILVIERHGTRGRLRLQCPTPGCASSPSEWVYANPILFATSKVRSPRSQGSSERTLGVFRIFESGRGRKTVVGH